MFFFIFMVAVFLAAMRVAFAASIYIQRFMDLIWQDPMTKRRAAIVKRVKELCVDGDVPEETAVLMTAKEQNMMEGHVRSILGNLTPATMKLAKKGGVLDIMLKAYKGVGWFGTGGK
jgi:hypothetical protein